MNEQCVIGICQLLASYLPVMQFNRQIQTLVAGVIIRSDEHFDTTTCADLSEPASRTRRENLRLTRMTQTLRVAQVELGRVRTRLRHPKGLAACRRADNGKAG